MKNQVLKWTAAGAMASVAFGASAQAQSADALIDKLVQKGILTVKEANELREEADKDFKTAYQVKSGMPDWVESLKLGGDFRGRYEAFFSDNDTFTDRYRWRYRLRFGAVATLKNDLEVGFRLTSSEASGTFGGDPISGNTTFNSNASKKFLYIDQAYAKWSPLHTAEWAGTLAFGKMENPFVFSDMIFDQDYTPEGGAVQLAYTVNSQHVLKLIGGAFVLCELGADNNDAWMAGSQLRWDAAWNKKVGTSLGVAALAIANAEDLNNANVPNVNRGNTRVGAAGVPLYNFNPIVADAALTYTLDSAPLYAGAFPIKLAADYLYNPAAEGDNYGYSVGVTFGKSGKKKTWEASYTWKYLGSDAWYEEVVDSDFGAFYEAPQPNSGMTAGAYGSGTNTKGHIVKVAYSPYDSLTLSVKWFRTELINAVPAGSESMMNRLQVDAVLKF
jgi:hypothetical protein